MQAKRLGYLECAAFCLLALTMLAGTLLSMTSPVKTGIILCLPFFLLIAGLLRFPAWACSLVMALPVAATLFNPGTLAVRNVVIEWPVPVTASAVLILSLCKDQLRNLLSPVWPLGMGTMLVVICGGSAMAFAAQHYGWGYRQTAEGILSVLQALLILLASSLVCLHWRGRLAMLLVLLLTVFIAGI